MVERPGVARARVAAAKHDRALGPGPGQFCRQVLQAIIAIEDARRRRKMPERCAPHYEALCSASCARTCATTAGLSTFPVGFTGSGSVWNRHHVGTAKDATRIRM